VASELVPMGVAQDFETNARLLDNLLMSAKLQIIDDKNMFMSVGVSLRWID
jgi:hypothetical protein